MAWKSEFPDTLKPARQQPRPALVITPEYLASTNTETGHQRAVFCWAAMTDVRERYPELEWLFAVPNGGWRPKPIAAAMKAEGVKKGVLDICLPVRRLHYPMLWIELKRPATQGKRAGTTSIEQDKYSAQFRSIGCAVSVCVGWLEATQTLITYLELK